MSDPINANPTIIDVTNLPTRLSTDDKTTSRNKELVSELTSLSLLNPDESAESRSEEEEEDSDTEDYDPIDEQEIFDLIATISDPEHPLTLAQLAVVNLKDIKVTTNPAGISEVLIKITPTITHCSLATLIGLGIRARLDRSLPARYRIRILIKEGAHQSENQVNKQLNDKERVAAACENEQLLNVISQMLSTCNIVSCTSKEDLHAIQSHLKTINTDDTNQPTYIQKKNAEKMKKLNDLLSSKTNQLSKKRFAFQGDPIPPSSTTDKLTTHNETQPSTSENVPRTIIDQEEYLITETGHALITNFTNSIIKTGNPPSSIHLENGTGSTCDLTCSGPIFINNVRDSTLIISCHQARLHHVYDCTVIVKHVANNRIIIENCHGLKVSPGVEIDDFNHPVKNGGVTNPNIEWIT
ncbi:hypothetical protein SBY92_002810 [Candida maltosa Xu316]